MEKKAEVKVKTLTVKSLVVALILSVCVPMYYLAFNAGAPGFQLMFAAIWGRHTMWPPVLGFLFIPIVLSAASSKLRFTKGELAFIYSMMVVTYFLVGVTSQATNYSRLWWGVVSGLQSAGTATYIRQNLPAIMGSQISAGAIAGMTIGNHPPGWYPVPWNELATPILYFTAMTVSLWLSLLFGGQILYGVWSRVESLAFPLETALTRLFDWSTEGSEGSKPTLFKQKILWIGFLIGVLATFYQNLPVYWPPYILPDLLGAGNGIYGYFHMFDRMTTFHSGVGWEPWAFGFALIVPTSVNFTVGICWIIFMIILFPVMVSIGEFANPLTYSPSLDHWWAVWAPAQQGVAAPVWRLGYNPILLGLSYAAAFVPLVWYWRAFYETVKSKEYRVSWIGYGVCTLIFLGMMLIGNIPIQYALMMMFLMFLSYVMHARMFAECGGYLGMIPIGGGISINFEGDSNFHNLMILMGSQGNPAGTYPASLVASYYFGGQDYQGGGGQIRNPLQWSISGLKVGDNAKSSRNHIFIAQLIAIAIAVILITVLWTTAIYYWCYFTVGDFVPFTYAYNLSLRTPTPTAYGGLWSDGPINMLYIWALAIGVGTVIAVSKLKFGGVMRFISPISFYLFAAAGGYLWFPFLVTFIVKLLVTRMMGSGAVESKLYPLGLGIVVGFCVMWIPSGIVQILKGVPVGFGLRWWP